MKSFNEFKESDTLNEKLNTNQVIKIIDKIAGLTKSNDHTGALYLLAKTLKVNKYITITQSIRDIQGAEGSMPNAIIKYENEVRKILLSIAKKEYSLVYKELLAAF